MCWIFKKDQIELIHAKKKKKTQKTEDIQG